MSKYCLVDWDRDVKVLGHKGCGRNFLKPREEVARHVLMFSCSPRAGRWVDSLTYMID